MNPIVWRVGAVASAITLGGAYVWLQHEKSRQSPPPGESDDPALMLSSKNPGRLPVDAITQGKGDFVTPMDPPVLMPSSKVMILPEFTEITVIPGIPTPGEAENPEDSPDPLRAVMGSSKSGPINLDDEAIQRILKEHGINLDNKDPEEEEQTDQP